MTMPGADSETQRLEIPDGPTPLTVQAKVGRYFNIALMAANQRDCDCYACQFLRSISELTVKQAASELEPPAPTPAAPAPAAPAAVESAPNAGDSPNSQ